MSNKPLWPQLLVLTTPSGILPFWWDSSPEMVVPFDITQKSIKRSELDGIGKTLGVSVRDVARCAAGLEPTADLIVGYRFTVKTTGSGGLPYDLAHHLRILKPLDRVDVRTNWIDRTKEQIFLGCYVEADPELNYEAGGQLAGEEYYSLQSLSLIWLMETM